ncbi:MAG: flagellar motor protein MotD [Pseudomonadota bacterium]
MARKKLPEEHENHERWLVSYADFITLLFAFFVVMYAISSLNEGKYRVMADSIVKAFREQEQTDQMIRLGSKYPELMPGKGQPIGEGIPKREIEDPKKVSEREKMKQIANKVVETMQPLVQSGQVKVSQSSKGITLEINASVLFASGDARLQPNSLQLLSAVAKELAKIDNPIQVEGHTDNIPIKSEYFPSNWELSSARAGSVVRLFVEQGVAPARLEAIGFADNRPIDTNVTPEGRARNRRVNVLILDATTVEAKEILRREVQN